MDITHIDIIGALENKGYAVFDDDSKPFNLNIVGIRSDKLEAGKFKDLICVFWKNEGYWNLFKSQCTTVAGLHYLQNPMNPAGCAILKPGQYRGAYRIGKHRGKYDALIQVKPVEVYRDDNRDVFFDEIDSSVQKGYFGINIHRAHYKFELDNVGKYSAGCQVIQDPNEFELFMKLAELSAEQWGDSFTYTLINESDI